MIKKVRKKATDPCYRGWGLRPVYLHLEISPLPAHSFEFSCNWNNYQQSQCTLGTAPVPGQSWDQGGSNPQYLQALQHVVLEDPPLWLDLSALIWSFRWMTIIPRVCTTLLHFPNIFRFCREKRKGQALAPGPDSGTKQWSSHQGRRAKAWWRPGEDQDSPPTVNFLFLKAFLTAIKLSKTSHIRFPTFLQDLKFLP